MSALSGIIQRAIASEGPVTFRWFMEQALYHPEHGYYASGKAAIGKGGDFFTSVSVGSLFGRLLSAQFNEMWQGMGKPERFYIVEQGANDGRFASDVLGALDPEFARAVQYRIVEPFEAMRRKQQETLRAFGPKVSWRNSLADLEPFQGVHFSNELLDAMPVHLLVLRAGEWKEKCVDWRGEAFVFVERPILGEELRRFLQDTDGQFQDGSQIEANLDALAWVEAVSAKLMRGYVLLIDYGDTHPATGQGTLACYQAHRRTDDPLRSPGEMDITTRVSFPALARHGIRAGLGVVEGFADQHHFLTGLVTSGLPDTATAREKTHAFLAFNQLTHPNLMGMQFKVLCFRKDVERRSPLQGFAFGRDPAAALGLD